MRTLLEEFWNGNVNPQEQSKELDLCKEEMLKKYKPPLDPHKDEV